jgi:hypothetical protein
MKNHGQAVRQCQNAKSLTHLHKYLCMQDEFDSLIRHVLNMPSQALENETEISSTKDEVDRAGFNFSDCSSCMNIPQLSHVKSALHI